MKKTNSDHIKMHQDRETGTHRCECWHCGIVQGIALPMPIATFAKLLKGFALEHRGCPRPAHIEIVDQTHVICHHCGWQTRSIQGAHLDIPAEVAKHRLCPAPVAPAVPDPQIPRCPLCTRLLDLSSRMSGDTLLCSCNASLLIHFVAGGARITLVGQVPATRGRRRK